MDDEITFQNMDTWRGSSNKFGLTFKQIILMHINRCVLNGSVEWHGGYWQEKLIQGNVIERVYVHDSREVYCDSVRILRALLLGYFDDKINKAEEKLNEEYTDNKKEFGDAHKRNEIEKKEWLEFRVDWHIRLFEQLVLLGKRLNFFEEETSEDEI